MIISEETLEVLKNFATINPNIVFKPGFQLKTISEAKTILASSKIVEDFQKEFGVYDLNEFLSVMNLIETPQLDFEEKAVVIKNNVAVSFGTGEDNKAEEFFSLAAKSGYEPEQSLKVEPSTLRALFRERVQNGLDMPSDIFNVFIKDETKITRKK